MLIKMDFMRNVFVIVLIIFGFVISLDAQISLRPQVGINSPSLSEDLQVGDWDASVGYQFGADVQIGSEVYFQAGLNFQISGLSIENVGDLDVSNINVPAYIGYRIGTEDRALALRLFAGPNFSLHISEDLGDAINEINTDNIKDFRISGAVGAGLDFSILFADIIYNFGLSDFIEGAAIESSKQNVFLINLGIRIGI